jgi:hypothetical protein
MKRLLPGVYDDEHGGLHINAGELLRANGYVDTPTNRETLVTAALEMMRPLNVPIVVSHDPVPE